MSIDLTLLRRSMAKYRYTCTTLDRYEDLMEKGSKTNGCCKEGNPAEPNMSCAGWHMKLLKLSFFEETHIELPGKNQ